MSSDFFSDSMQKLNRERRVVVAEEGKPVTTPTPFEPDKVRISFADRRLASGFKELPLTDNDSGEWISADRDRA